MSWIEIVSTVEKADWETPYIYDTLKPMIMLNDEVFSPAKIVLAK